mgnify:CR=1 FL=1
MEVLLVYKKNSWRKSILQWNKNVISSKLRDINIVNKNIHNEYYNKICIWPNVAPAHNKLII